MKKINLKDKKTLALFSAVLIIVMGVVISLARYVYETIFKHNNPPKDVLLRDHARNIV